jgi:hypothetical protein
MYALLACMLEVSADNTQMTRVDISHWKLNYLDAFSSTCLKPGLVRLEGWGLAGTFIKVLSVASPCDLGFFTACQPGRIWSSYTAGESSKGSALVPKQKLPDLSWLRVGNHLLPLPLVSIVQCYSSLRARVKGHRQHCSIEQYQVTCGHTFKPPQSGIQS